MLGLLSAGIAPALTLMAFFYLKDNFTEPLSLTVKMFLFGALLVFPIMFIQYGFSAEHISDSNLMKSFLVSGLLEEFFKWFIFLYVIFHHTDFDAHYDGIVYAVAISLGFAAVENILYLFTNGIEYAFSRALFPVSSHALFGVMMGYHFGRAKTDNNQTKWQVSLALFVPFLLHGTYNYILDMVTRDWEILLASFMIGLWFLALRRMKTANRAVIDNAQQPKKTLQV